MLITPVQFSCCLTKALHLGVRRRKKAGPGVGERLQAAYEKVMAQKGKG